MRKALSILLLCVLVGGFTFVGSVNFCTAQIGTNVTGIISQDATWTPKGSPYALAGNTLVNQGITLTIQPGVTVNLGSYYIEIEGTLSAIGNPTDKITFNGGQITFTSSSNGWNEQNDSGCIIENAVLGSTGISMEQTSTEIYNDVLDSSPIEVIVGSPVITNNTFYGCGIGFSAVLEVGQANGDFGGNPIITDNIISNAGGYGISIGGGSASILGNTIYGCQNAVALSPVEVMGGTFPVNATVEMNLLTNNSRGVSVFLDSRFSYGTESPTIVNNTISENSIGVYLVVSNVISPFLKGNNIENNSNYNVYAASGSTGNVDASKNWWGTTDPQAINQSIYDFKDNFNLGTVNFVPFLTEANLQAIPNPNAPMPTSTPVPTSILIQSQRPSPTTTSASPPISGSSPLGSSSQQPTAPPQPNTMSQLSTELIVAAVAIAVAVIAAGAFLLGKRAGRKNTI